MYYNSNHEVNPQLSASRNQTGKQDKIIYDYFLANPYAQKTALEIGDILNILHSSARRSCTDLIDDDKLIYCGKKMERYGKENNLIGLKPKFKQGELFND